MALLREESRRVEGEQKEVAIRLQHMSMYVKFCTRRPLNVKYFCHR